MKTLWQKASESVYIWERIKTITRVQAFNLILHRDTYMYIYNIFILHLTYHLGDVVVEVLEVEGLIPLALRVAGLAIRQPGRCQNKWTRNSSYLPRK